MGGSVRVNRLHGPMTRWAGFYRVRKKLPLTALLAEEAADAEVVLAPDEADEAEAAAEEDAEAEAEEELDAEALEEAELGLVNRPTEHIVKAG